MAPTPNTTSIPDAPPALSLNTPSRSDGFSPGAVIGIVIGIVILVLAVPIIAVCLRRYEKSRLRETPKSPSSSSASLRSVQEDHSLKSILVTKELSRSSVRMEQVDEEAEEQADERLRRPEEVYGGGRERERAWSSTEVHGGDK